jgi:hypothetical protein
MAGAEFAYLYLGCGLTAVWLLSLWYFYGGSAQGKSEHPWLAYFLVWPWLLQMLLNDPQCSVRELTRREMVMAMVLLLCMVGAIVFAWFLPEHFREVSP